MRRRSPAFWLLLGLAITLGAVGVFAWYSLMQVERLRVLQTNTIDRNRKDNLQLLRMESNLSAVGLALREMIQATPEYEIYAYQAEFERHRQDLEDAFRKEHSLAPARRDSNQQEVLQSTAREMWDTAGKAFQLSRQGREKEAQALIHDKVQLQHRALTALVSRLLFQNNELEQQAVEQVQQIYDGVERNTYIFLAAMLLLIVITSLSMIYANARLFRELEWLSEQKSVLAAKLISVQEEILNSISRELHDEFGQILTAVGAMLNRAQRKHVPDDHPLRADLMEVRTTVQETLQKVRSLSQALHPVVIDDYGLERALVWYAQVFERQHGIPVHLVVREGFPKLAGPCAIHAYRITQEALNNVAKHSTAREAWITLEERDSRIKLEIRDNGKGFLANDPGKRNGLGLVAMRERAAILNGVLKVSSAPGQGTAIVLEMPLPMQEPAQTEVATHV